MKVKTSDLIGTALDWAVAKCEGFDFSMMDKTEINQWLIPYSTDWAQGGPIIERECIDIEAFGAASSAPRNPDYWVATLSCVGEYFECHGSTPLIAAMRCYVASKLGETVDIPEELLK